MSETDSSTPPEATSAPAPEAPAAPAALPDGPDAAELREIEALYEAGDFREVHRRTAALLGRTQDDAVRGRAAELARRVQLDPFVLWAWAGTVIVVAGIVWAYVIR